MSRNSLDTPKRTPRQREGGLGLSPPPPQVESLMPSLGDPQPEMGSMKLPLSYLLAGGHMLVPPLSSSQDIGFCPSTPRSPQVRTGHSFMIGLWESRGRVRLSHEGVGPVLRQTDRGGSWEVSETSDLGFPASQTPSSLCL